MRSMMKVFFLILHNLLQLRLLYLDCEVQHKKMLLRLEDSHIQEKKNINLNAIRVLKARKNQLKQLLYR
jgi:hypothetical protein